MGNSRSKPAPRPAPAPFYRRQTQPVEDYSWEIRRINQLNGEIYWQQINNTGLRNQITNTNTNITNTKNMNDPILTGLYSKQDQLNDNIRITTDFFNRLKKNADITNRRMSEITVINDNLQKDTLKQLLVDVNTKKEIYKLVESQNKLIEKNSLDLLKNTDKNNQKNTYSLEQYNEFNNINTIFFILYYFLFIIFIFFVVFKNNYSVLLKIVIGLIFLFYPYIIYTIETQIYNIIYSLYLYTFSIFIIEPVY
jgi:hypothetical protein